jgi:hypothetical protein
LYLSHFSCIKLCNQTEIIRLNSKFGTFLRYKRIEFAEHIFQFETRLKEKEMKKLLLCLAFVILFVNFAQAQKTNLVNTTWKVYYKESGDKNWTSGGKLTFLRNGKIKDDDCYHPSHWKLVGSKLSYGNGCGDQMMFSVTIKGNQANGRGTVTWRELPIIVRLTKE